MSEAPADWRTFRPVFVYAGLLVGIFGIGVAAVVLSFIPVIQLSSGINDYTGDGRIELTSRSVISYGYRIDFESVNLSSPWRARYSLEGLPRIAREARAGLYFDEISDRVYSIRGGTLAMSLIVDGREVMSVDAPIEEWNFSDRIGIFVSYFDYKTKSSSSFDVGALRESGVPELVVDYVPPPGVDPELSGRLRLQVGGYY